MLPQLSPESISILLANGISLFDHHRELKFKFMGAFKVSNTVLSHHADDSVSFLQDMMNPPVKCWFILDASCYSIFGNLDWV